MFEKKRFYMAVVMGLTLVFNSSVLAKNPPIAPTFPSPKSTPSLPVNSDGLISGLMKQTGVLNGINHSWYLYMPKSYDGTKRVPLVVFLHGASSDGLSGILKTGWPEVAEREDFLVLSPDSTDRGGQNGWNAFYLYGIDGPDDITYLKQLIDKICLEYKIDKSRLYIQGQSRGNQMTAHFVSIYPSLFAAAAGTSGPTPFYMMKDVDGGFIKPKIPVPWYQWHGDLDVGDFRGTLHQVMDDQQRGYWAEINKTNRVPEVQINGRYTTEVYTGGEADFRFTEYTDGLHNTDLSAQNIIWNDLFRYYSRGADGKLVILDKEKKNSLNYDSKSVAFVVGTAKALIGGKQQITLENAPTELYADKTLVPLSAIAQTFGAKVEYRPDSKQITIRYGENIGVLKIDTPLITINKITVRQIDYMSPVVDNGVVMVPIRPVAELVLGKYVSYSSGAVYISNDPLVQIGQGTAHVLGRVLE